MISSSGSSSITIADSMIELLRAPITEPSILWLILPLISLWVLLEIYFGKHKKEQLGWNSTLANGMSLIWVGLSITKTLFDNVVVNFGERLIICLFIIFYGMIVIYSSYKHKFSPKVTFVMGSPNVIYPLGIFAVILGYGVVSITLSAILAALILFFIFIIILLIVRKVEKDDINSFDDSNLSSDTPDAMSSLSNMGTSSENMTPNLEDIKI